MQLTQRRYLLISFSYLLSKRGGGGAPDERGTRGAGADAGAAAEAVFAQVREAVAV